MFQLIIGRVRASKKDVDFLHKDMYDGMFPSCEHDTYYCRRVCGKRVLEETELLPIRKFFPMSIKTAMHRSLGAFAILLVEFSNKIDLQFFSFFRNPDI